MADLSQRAFPAEEADGDGAIGFERWATQGVGEVRRGRWEVSVFAVGRGVGPSAAGGGCGSFPGGWLGESVCVWGSLKSDVLGLLRPVYGPGRHDVPRLLRPRQGRGSAVHEEMGGRRHQREKGSSPSLPSSACPPPSAPRLPADLGLALVIAPGREQGLSVSWDRPDYPV